MALKNTVKSFGVGQVSLFPRSIAVRAVHESPPFERSLPLVGDFSLLLNLSASVEVGDGQARLSLSSGEIAILRHAIPEGAARTAELRCGDDAGTGERVELLIASFCAIANREERSVEPVVHVDAGTLRDNAAIQRVIELLRLELAGPAETDPRAARSLMDALCTYVARARAGRAGAAPRSARDARIARALEAMSARPERRWTLEVLAKLAGLSRAQFVRRFTECLGVPPLRYLSEWRLQLAMDLLTRDDDSLAVIAATVGYDSEFAFSRAFKRFAGEAPAIFRRRVRSGRSPILAMAA